MMHTTYLTVLKSTILLMWTLMVTYLCQPECCHLTQPYSRVDAYKYSFVPSAIKLWNTLPHDVVYQETVNNFQNKLLTNIIANL